MFEATNSRDAETAPDEPVPASSAAHLTIDEAATELRCGRDTVTRLIQSGRLAAKDLGTGRHHNYRIRRGDLEELADPIPKQQGRRRRRTGETYARLA